jgi:hypothetical protein
MNAINLSPMGSNQIFKFHNMIWFVDRPTVVSCTPSLKPSKHKLKQFQTSQLKPNNG